MNCNAQSVNQKIDEMDLECHNNGIDICAVTEIWLNDEIPTSAIKVSGYWQPLRNDQLHKRGGGVAVFVKEGFQYITGLN